MLNSEQLIAKLNLQPHPEGGFFRETYRSETQLQMPGFEGLRNYSTAIYFLLTSDTFSAFHKIKQDEMWHFYLGSPIELHIISTNGHYSCVTIGNSIVDDQYLQYVVRGGDYFAARTFQKKNAYSLLGCTVAPGFNFVDFEMPSRNTLLELFPQHRKIIMALTQPE